MAGGFWAQLGGYYRRIREVPSCLVYFSASLKLDYELLKKRWRWMMFAVAYPLPLVKGYQTDDTIHFFGIQIETVRVSCSAHANTD
jgi:hypothetical protein